MKATTSLKIGTRVETSDIYDTMVGAEKMKGSIIGYDLSDPSEVYRILWDHRSSVSIMNASNIREQMK